MIKNDLVNRVAEAARLPRSAASLAVATIIETLVDALAKGDRIELRGFGVFVVRPRKRGVGRNPKRPDVAVEIPPGITVRFKPGKELRAMLVPDPKDQ